jgi:hypothetical protein
MGTIITKPGGGGAQVGYRGFKYNVKSIVTTYPNPYPVPVPGEAIYHWEYGEDFDTFVGISINKTNADGFNIGSIASDINNQALTVTYPNGTYTIVGSSFSNDDFYNYSTYVFLERRGSFTGDSPQAFNSSYINLETAVKYNGYVLSGSLNGATLSPGTYYVSPGATTASTNVAARTIQVSGSYIMNAYINVSGSGSGNLAFNLLVNGTVVAAPTTLAGGTPGTWQIINSGGYSIPNNATLTLRLIQTGGTVSYNIDGFYYIIK